MDYQDILLRYLGRLVTITTFGYIKIWGEVAEVNGDHVRLINTLVTTEHDDQGWYSQIQHADLDSNCGPRNAETIIQFHQIVAISCQDTIHPDAAPYGRNADQGSAVADEKEEPRLVSSGQPHPETLVAETPEDVLERSLHLDRLRLEIGMGLVKLATAEQGDLLRRIPLVRSQVAGELGIAVPRVRVQDNPRLAMSAYRILLEDAPIAAWELTCDRLLAIDSGQVTKTVPGTAAKEPVYGLPALWIMPGQREQAEMHGYLVCEPGAALAVHLQHVLKEYAAEMFSVDDLRQLLTRLEKIAPAAASEATLRVPVPELHVVLRRLLMEEVSIKNLPRILEAIALRACSPHESEDLVIAARLAISRAMCHELCGEDGRLYVVMLDRSATNYVQTQLAEGDTAKTDWVHHLVTSLSRFFRDAPERRRDLALLVEADLRLPLWKLVRPRLGRQVVLSRDEVPSEVPLEVVRILDLEDLGVQQGSLVDTTGETLVPARAFARPRPHGELPPGDLPRQPR
ncbi:MAG: FHIPEP family type III secretion protein [Pirellulaceae bacterium]